MSRKGEHNAAEDRLSWDEFFILLATLYSARGTCDRLRTATILVKDKRIVGAGYNGSVAGAEHCDDAGHLIVNGHCLRTLHSEQNAIFNAIGDLRGATAYMVAVPCINCAKSLLQKGVKRIVYVADYDNSKGYGRLDKHVADLCEEMGVSVEKLSDDPSYVVGLLKRAMSRLQGQGGFFKGLNNTF